MLSKTSKSDTLEMRKKHVGYNVTLNYASDPIMFLRGQGQYLYDENETQFLDGVNNVCHVGHCHPDVVAATSKQLGTLNTNSRFLHPVMSCYAKDLVSTFCCNAQFTGNNNSVLEKNRHIAESSKSDHKKLDDADIHDGDPTPGARRSPIPAGDADVPCAQAEPLRTVNPHGSSMAMTDTNEGVYFSDLAQYIGRDRQSVDPDHQLSIVFFVNSGSEANDLALRLARTYTKLHDVMILEGAYHGHLSSMIDMSPYKFDHAGGNGKQNWVHMAPSPDVFRGKYRGDANDPEMGRLYAKEAVSMLQEANKEGKHIAAFYAESMISCGGQILLPPEYLRTMYSAIRAQGGVCIADEVQVGFGRVGDDFWAFESSNVVPDIVTMGKPMGNGFPVAAVITSPAIARAFNNGMGYFNTYGGNPVACAAGQATLDVIRNERLMTNAADVGNYLLEGFKRLQDAFPQYIGDIRGRGLFVGLEIIANGDRSQFTNARSMTLSEFVHDNKWNAKSILDASTIIVDPKCQNVSSKEASSMDVLWRNRLIVPFPQLAQYVMMRMKQHHKILVAVDGPDENVIKMKPPMVFSIEDAKQTLDALHQCFTMAIQDGLDNVYEPTDHSVRDTEISNVASVSEIAHDTMKDYITRRAKLL